MSTSDLQPTQSATLERIEDIVRDLLGDPAISLTAATRPGEVDGWDSLANVSIIFGVEEEFGVQLGDEVLSGFETVGQLAVLVERKRAAEAAA